MKKYWLIVNERSGFVEIDARNEHEAVEKASSMGLSVRSIREAEGSRAEKLVKKMIPYVEKQMKHEYGLGLTYTEIRAFWRDCIGMTEDEMDKYGV